MAALVGLVGGTLYITSGSGLWFQRQPGDHVSEAEKQGRLTAFAALGTMPLARVPEGEMSVALQSMQLTTEAKQTLLSDLGHAAKASSTSRPGNTRSPSPSADPSLASGQVKTQPSVPADQMRSGPLATPEAMPRVDDQLRLAWVTFWDTDAEDGDVVRIDSQGYSRTITLTKQPVTFAIPVPPSGVVNVTGIRDGEGGGITVGLASGQWKAEFPIMSEGQVLGLKVRVY